MPVDILLGLAWRSLPAFVAALGALWARFAGRLAAAGATLGALLRTWRQRRRSRAELAEMDDLALRDLGSSRAQALFEASKPFWRA